MPDVVRFALDSERDLYVPGAGKFTAGILDIPAGNAALLSRVRFLIQPYRAVELGVTDETTPFPDLPAAGPGAALTDPYPQYLTEQDVPTSAALRAAFGRAAPVSAMLSKIDKAATGIFRVMMTGTSIATFDRAPNQVLAESLKTIYGDTNAYQVRAGVLGGTFGTDYSGWKHQRYGGPFQYRLRGASTSTAISFQFYGDQLTVEFSRETDSEAAPISIDGVQVGTTPAAGAQAYSQKQTFTTATGVHTATIGVPTGAGFVYFEHLVGGLAARTGVEVRDATLGGSTLGGFVNVPTAGAGEATSVAIVGDNGLNANFARTDVDLHIVSYVVNDAGNAPLGSYFASTYKPAIDKVVAATAAAGAQLCLIIEMGGHYSLPNDGGNANRYNQFNQIRDYLLTLGRDNNHVTVVDQHAATIMTDLAAYAARYYPAASALNVAAGTYTGDFIHAEQPGPQVGTALIHRAAGVPQPKRVLASLVAEDRIRTVPAAYSRDQKVTIGGVIRRLPASSGPAVIAVGAGDTTAYQKRVGAYFRDPTPANQAASAQTAIDASGTVDATHGPYLAMNLYNVGLGNTIDWAGGQKRTLTMRARGTVQVRVSGITKLYSPDGTVMPVTDVANDRTQVRYVTSATEPAVFSVVVGATAGNGTVALSGDVFEVALVDSNVPVLVKDAPTGGSGPQGAAGPAGGVASPMVSGRWGLATLFGTSSTATLTAGRVYGVPFIPKTSGSLDQVGIEITTGVAGATVRLGVYAHDATTGLPTTLLGDAGTIDASTTGFKSAALPSSIPVTAGSVYWLAYCGQGSAAAIVRTVNGISPLLSVDNTSQSGPSVYRYTLDTTSPLSALWSTSYLIDNLAAAVRARAV